MPIRRRVTLDIGVVNGLFAALKQLGAGDVAAIARAARMDAGYVRRWCDAAFAFGYLDAESEVFRLSEMGGAMLPDAPDTLMPLSERTNASPSERGSANIKRTEISGLYLARYSLMNRDTESQNFVTQG